MNSSDYTIFDLKSAVCDWKCWFFNQKLQIADRKLPSLSPPDHLRLELVKFALAGEGIAHVFDALEIFLELGVIAGVIETARANDAGPSCCPARAFLDGAVDAGFHERIPRVVGI